MTCLNSEVTCKMTCGLDTGSVYKESHCPTQKEFFFLSQETSEYLHLGIDLLISINLNFYSKSTY